MELNKRFLLRPFMDNDAHSLARQLNNKNILNNLRDVQWFIDFQRNEPSLTCYAIVVDGNVVGNIGIRAKDIE